MPLPFALLVLILAAPEGHAAKPFTGELAKEVYERLLDEPEQTRKNVLSKDGSIACWENGKAPELTHSCDCGEEEGVDRLNGTMAEQLYKKLPAKTQSSDGEGGQLRHADFRCTQSGTRAPYSFGCTVR